MDDVEPTDTLAGVLLTLFVHDVSLLPTRPKASNQEKSETQLSDGPCVRSVGEFASRANSGLLRRLDGAVYIAAHDLVPFGG